MSIRLSHFFADYGETYAFTFSLFLSVFLSFFSFSFLFFFLFFWFKLLMMFTTQRCCCVFCSLLPSVAWVFRSFLAGSWQLPTRVWTREWILAFLCCFLPMCSPEACCRQELWQRQDCTEKTWDTRDFSVLPPPPEKTPTISFSGISPALRVPTYPPLRSSSFCREDLVLPAPTDRSRKSDQCTLIRIARCVFFDSCPSF